MSSPHITGCITLGTLLVSLSLVYFRVDNELYLFKFLVTKLDNVCEVLFLFFFSQLKSHY